MKTNDTPTSSASHVKILDHLAYSYEMSIEEMLEIAKTRNPIYLERLAKKRFLPIEAKRAICEYGTPFNCLQLINRGGIQDELYPLIAINCIDTIKTHSKGCITHFNAISLISPEYLQSVLRDANAVLKNVCVADLHGEDLTEVKHLIRKIGFSNDVHLLQLALENGDFNLLHLLRLRKFAYIDYEHAFAINCLSLKACCVWENTETQMYAVKSNNEIILRLMLDNMHHSSLPHEVSIAIFKYCSGRMIELILSNKWIGYSAELELINSKNFKAIGYLLKYSKRMSDDAKKAIKQFKKAEWNNLLKERFGYV